jgi:adenylate kinase
MNIWKEIMFKRFCIQKHHQNTENNYPKPLKLSRPQTIFMKRVILVTGTPCVGKTTTAKALTQKLGALYINLTDYAKTNGLVLEEDKERNSLIIDEENMPRKLAETINASENANIIIDGHYASAVTPTEQVTKVFVLRRDPRELKQLMEKCGYTGSKMWENMQAEIIDVCLSEAVELHAEKVCELDVTGRSVEEVVGEILDVLEKRKSCFFGLVDWLGLLEKEGLTDEYLKI